MESRRLDNLLDRAIVNEEDARDFYRGLRERVSDAGARETLTFLADEEERHRLFLVDYRAGRRTLDALPLDSVIDYGIAQHLESPAITSGSTAADLYLLAAHRELNSYQFYRGLAALQPAGEVRDLLERMAAEEMKHKEKVEYLYSNAAFPQTEGG